MKPRHLIPSHEAERETQPTLGFQRVLQRAVFHVQSSGKKEVTGANVLVAIFSEQESQAVYFLKKQSIARIDVVNFISHGISKVHDDNAPMSNRKNRPKMKSPWGEAAPRSALEAYTSNLNELARQGKIDPW
jgi:ATP-dependent Clp protease ATP-binding subunit ClpA